MLRLIDVPWIISSGLIMSVLALVTLRYGSACLVSPFLSAPFFGCTTNLKAHVVFRFDLCKGILRAALLVACSLGCSAFGGMP